MGLFSTRNNDGAPSLAEPCNTISSSDMADLRNRAMRREHENGGVLSPESTRRRLAHDPRKAGTN